MDITAQLRGQLEEGCRRVPIEAFQKWDYERVLAYKKAVQAGKKVLAKARATEGELSAAINRIAAFW
jgi:hypothetical protein